MNGLTSPQHFHGEEKPAQKWTLWKQQVTLFQVASGLQNKSKLVQSTTLLHVAGEEIVRIYNTFTFADDEDKEDVKVLLKKLDDHFLPQKNVDYERHVFFISKQGADDTIDKFITDLKSKASSCELDTLEESLIKTVLIIGLRSDKLRARLLALQNSTLTQVINMCKAEENTKAQMSKLSNENSEDKHVDELNRTRRRHPYKPKDTGENNLTVESVVINTTRNNAQRLVSHAKNVVSQITSRKNAEVRERSSKWMTLIAAKTNF
jgi:hypothetical protein